MCPVSASPPEVFCYLLRNCISIPLRFISMMLAHLMQSQKSASGNASISSLGFFRLRNCLITKQQNNPYCFFLRKEVIQPHLPIRLPCYDFTPVIEPAFGSSLLTVGSLTSGIPNSHGVTGGVYKTRERIHRNILICDY